MILLDTNVVIYASDADSPFHEWARRTIAEAVAGEGAAVNAVVVAELCVGDANPSTVADRLQRWGIVLLDVPVAAAELSAKAYRGLIERRAQEHSRPSSGIPLPDFFIGAHAMLMDWPLATADRGRFDTYFPAVALKLPE